MPLDWVRDGRDWPNREASRFVEAAGLRWHVQIAGEGPSVLLLHGTGAATHSWRDVFPALARHARVVAPDLPGHGFTSSGPLHRLSLPGMSQSVAGLLHALDEQPRMVVGHSAGAAIAIRMTLEGTLAPGVIAALNPALLPFGGMAGQLFSPLAKLLVLNPLVPRLFAWRASDRAMVERLIRETGSTLDARGIALYQLVVRNADHASGALGMMANWDLQGFTKSLAKLSPPLVLIVGDRDRTVPPAQAREVKRFLPSARLVTLPGLGHLAHEEKPEIVTDLLLTLLRERTERAA